MSLFSRIKETSKEQGLLLKEVADKIGTTAGNMTRWDTNRPSVDKVVSVAQILGVSVDYLVGLTDEKKPVPTDGNGLSDAQRELIRILPTLTPGEVSVLLATAKAQVANRKFQDGQE